MNNDYRFGFNGMEKDNEVKGIGNSMDFGARIYDSRLGKFLSIDPLIRKYPGFSSYLFAANTPIQAIDRLGMDGFKIIKTYYCGENKPRTKVVKDESIEFMLWGCVYDNFNGCQGTRSVEWRESKYKKEPMVKIGGLIGSKGVNITTNYPDNKQIVNSLKGLMDDHYKSSLETAKNYAGTTRTTTDPLIEDVEVYGRIFELNSIVTKETAYSNEYEFEDEAILFVNEADLKNGRAGELMDELLSSGFNNVDINPSSTISAGQVRVAATRETKWKKKTETVQNKDVQSITDKETNETINKDD